MPKAPWILFCGLLAALPAVCVELSVVEAVVADFQGGIGVPDDREFLPGQRVHVAFRVAGFKQVTEGKLHVEYEIEPVDCLGNPFAQPTKGRIVSSASSETTRLIRADFEVPAMPWPGQGAFRITVRDRVAETQATASVPFLVGSTMPEPPPEFAITDVRAFDSEYAEAPVKAGTFNPGSTVWGRFLLSGFRTAESNRFKLSYGVTLKNKTGRIVFREAQAVSESHESFYPRWYVPGVISVRLEPTIRPGDYTLTIDANDEIGNARALAEFSIRVLP